jgi:NADH-quinone oxidoreductase subunit E
MLSEQAKDKIREQMSRYPVSRSALGHALYIAQEECGGWVPHEAIKDIGEVMNLEPADVQSMMSFYVMYNKAPIGKYLIEVCHNISCVLMGSQRLLDTVEHKCGIHPGETTEDGMFTLKAIECSALCGSAPVLQINGMFHEHMTPAKVEELLDRLRAEGGPKDNLYNSVYAADLAGRTGKG